MATSMRFGVSLPNDGDPREFVRLAVDLERAGWDGFFLWDHMQISAEMRPDVVDPWTVLGAIATATERIALGTMVTPIPRRRPWKVAREVTTLDHLSGGRVILGVGLGWPPDDDFGAFGETTSSRTHAAMLDEALPLLDSFLRGERVDHDGEYYQVHAHLAPAALQAPRPPIWVGTHLDNRRVIERARRWDGIKPQAWPGMTPEQVATLAATLGRGPAFDIVVGIGPDAPIAELADAGATWAIAGMLRPQEPLDEVRARLLPGPPR
jgi:alkanesulfonate monooxygenase SsuD/methylene tetrahydromethanopterin reductase-like flavin-dependent oxidoreductase (luciferase family)